MAVVGLGCGKGLPLLVAARLGFAEIIGVEFAPKLAAIARSNAEIMGIKNISVDVGELRFPCSNIVLFLFNHFGDHVTEKVLDNLNHQVEQVSHAIVRPPLYIIYGNPGALLERCGFLIKLDTLRWEMADCHISTVERLHEEFRQRISQDPDGATIGGHNGDVVLALLAAGRVEMRKEDTRQILAEKPSDKIIDLVA